MTIYKIRVQVQNIKNAFYPINSKRIQLPECHIKAYVDSCCYEFQETDTDTKLMHLLYVTDKGFDVVAKIKDFLKSHEYVSEESIKTTLADFIAEMRYPGEDKYSVIDRIYTSEYIAEYWSLDDIYEILMIEARKNFSYTEDNIYIEFSRR
ncbi:MAG: hypothetical protein MJY63_05680 [Paludibacteraceae bacterium]|nr:hypothetical protein [Paludibacteraceae bacterium]